MLANWHTRSKKWLNWFNLIILVKLGTHQRPKLTSLTYLYAEGVKRVKFDRIGKFVAHAKPKLTILSILACTRKICDFSAKSRNLWPRVGLFFGAVSKRGKLRFWNFWFIFYMHKAKKFTFFGFFKNRQKSQKMKKCEFTLKTPQTLVQFVVLMDNFPFGRVL